MRFPRYATLRPVHEIVLLISRTALDEYCKRVCVCMLPPGGIFVRVVYHLLIEAGLHLHNPWLTDTAGHCHSLLSLRRC